MPVSRSPNQSQNVNHQWTYESTELSTPDCSQRNKHLRFMWELKVNLVDFNYL